ncbi:hypothetical protein GLAREA_08721 [Glarea lozoyensis ATCC 20868]|uniref:2EXR domain-containing protein n=1 Tax=Glarea lozoyensis (strain ATCC 20868 / MF5171) TaxID=1116229 RepID=S3EE62_GLAL2|nr:uncharacterized protein GLAREA_08721 [Glarea lozoyensis ATCC 20868]EPE36558.1 hypothetical protein GLAREA_08721 [Glarea lozoyensis ATCC 20868]
MSPQFHLFSLLPPELRTQIWLSAFSTPPPTFYFYKPGAWKLTPCSCSLDSSALDFVFDHKVYDAVQLDIPLFFVNREARAIARAWMRENDVEEVEDGEREERVVFRKEFNPVKDVLFMPYDQWEKFACEGVNRGFANDALGRYLHSGVSTIMNLALPVELFQSSTGIILELGEVMEQWYQHLQVLYLIIDPPSDLRPVNDGMKIQPRWNLKDSEGGSFIWNYESRSFDYRQGEETLDPALCALIREISMKLGEELTKNNIIEFETRPVFAVKQSALE